MEKIPFAKPMIEPDVWHWLADKMAETTRLTDGDFNEKFATRFSQFISGGAAYCLPTSSCMSALTLAYMVLGIGQGDEVICPAMSHVATAHAIELAGATPVFVDCEWNGNIDVDLIEFAITRRTKAITLVHYNGMPCDMDYILGLAEAYGLRVVEDCALAVGTQYRGQHVGTFGDVGCFSFYPSKHITTGEGGMFVCGDYGLAQKAKRRSSFGKEGSAFDYDMVVLGSNFRMSEMQAALGVAQLKQVEGFVARRRNNARQYLNALAGSQNYKLRFFEVGNHKWSPYAMVLYGVRDRYALMGHLRNEGIGFSVYYPHPIPRLRYYRDKYGYAPKRYPNAIAIADESLVLPVGPHMNDVSISRVTEAVWEFYK